MADPTDPTSTTTSTDPTAGIAATTASIQDQTAALEDLSQATDTQGRAYAALNVVGTSVKGVMDNIENIFSNVGVTLGNITSLTEDQITQFGLLSSAFVNARDSFANFAGVDYKGIATLTDHINNIKEALKNVPATQAAAALEALGPIAARSGVSNTVWAQTIAKGTDAVLALTENLAKHADNMNRARTAYIQMAAKTGELGDALAATGAGFKDLDTILERQKVTIEDTAEATGLTVAQTEQWYNQLGLIPGALKSVVDISEKGGRTMSMLTAAIQTAVGTGRAQEDVMRDLNTAFRDYGLVGEKALLFSVRMSDVSTRLKAPIEDVTTALRGSADAFKMFVTGQESAEKSAESLATMMNTYGKALESTGLSASQSVGVVSELAAGVSRLSIGQQAFISQQTGGPGGLMGAARQQLKTPGEQVEDAMSTLKKQFGEIVTVKDAAESEAAANQWVKQTAMLQQLLGPLAKDQQSANRLLEAMKNQGEGQTGAIAEALKPTAVQDAAKQGMDLQKQSNMFLADISHTLDRIRDLGDIGAGRALGTVAAGATAGTRGEAQGRVSAIEADRMRLAAERSGTRTTALAGEIATGNVRSTAGLDFATSLNTTMGTVREIPSMMSALGETLTAQSASETVRNAAGASTAAVPPGQQVGTAARAAAARPAAEVPGAATDTTRQGPGANAAPTAPQTIKIEGKFTLDCPTCGRPHDVSPQASIYPQQYKQG